MNERRRVDQKRGTAPPLTTMSLIQAYGEPPADWFNAIRPKCWMTWVEWQFEGNRGNRVAMRAETLEEATRQWALLEEIYGFNRRASANEN